MFKTKKKLFIFWLLIGIVAVAVTGYMLSAKRKKEELLAKQNQQVTAVVERRTLANSISATGKISSLTSKDVVVGLNNIKIQSLPVKVGDMVETGTLLCEFDQTDLSGKLSDAKKSLATAQQKGQLDVAAAERTLSEAQTNAEIELRRQDQDLTTAWNEFIKAVQDMEKAKVTLDDATKHIGACNGEYQYWQGELNKLVTVSANVSGNSLLVENSLESQKVSYWQGKVEAAKQAESSAKAAYEQAQAAVTTKDEAYKKQLRAKEDAIRNSDSNLANRNDTLTTSRLAASTSTISDKQKVEDLEKQLADCTVLAPVSGVITQVRFKEGDTYTGGALLTIEDISSYEVLAEINEYDIGRIKVGQKVVMKTNGTGEEELEGEVLYVAPRATTSSGTTNSSVTYSVRISVDTKNELLKLDMTAKLSIITNQKENILTVPYEAIIEDEAGGYYVEVLQGDSTKKVAVEKGIESDYYVEVIGAELVEGSQVVIPTNENDAQNIQELLESEGPMGGF